MMKGMNRGAVVLLYNVEVAKEKEIRVLGMKCGIRVKKVPLEEYKKAIGYEAGIKATPTSNEVYEGPELESSVIIMRNFNQAMINVMLMMVTEVGGIDYKAILTTTNAEWDIFKLIEELDKEREAAEGTKEQQEENKAE